jgi:membrane protease YdiL (CAAX protease family)
MSANPTSSQRPLLSRIFLSPDEPRLRAGWRFFIQTLLMLLLIGCFWVLVSLLLYFQTSLISNQWFMLISEGISLISITLSVFLVRRYIDKRPFSSLGLLISKNLIPDLLVGFLIAFLSIGLVFFLEWQLGWIQISWLVIKTQSPAAIILGTSIALFTFILVGWNEELLSRGYHLQTLTSGLKLPLGLILSSAIFAFLHLLNPYATWVSTMIIFFAGLILAFGYIRTQQLWLSIGFHIGWNFSEGVVFGFPVSGWDGFHLSTVKNTGPVLWTGGLFGPEAGLILLPALILGTLLILIYTHPGIRNGR